MPNFQKKVNVYADGTADKQAESLVHSEPRWYVKATFNMAVKVCKTARKIFEWGKNKMVRHYHSILVSFGAHWRALLN